ncbi:hypothetical protein H0264_35920 [Nocardia huaxiensis]|uniref:Lipoprotein n=1 Tax=Nocardia huaxiensis TaxID=2755382 RepID=A0A7D6ZH89_9NOCA|nr:hypothetical protein [Nocardia huaxiensis]QLY30447.1 hypothetical protein H0264_35920 [Nocardia huaxiensis]
MAKSGAGVVWGAAAIVVCSVLTACGGSDQHAGHTTVTPNPSRALTSTAPQPSSTIDRTTTPAATAPVGEVPGNPAAAAALRPWVADLLAGDLDTLVRKCWTIEPGNARAMYADEDAILAAVAEPGIDGQFAVLWKGPAVTVSVKRTEIASGYACPRVAPTGSAMNYNEADAAYAVHRYLSRFIGKPVNPADTEGAYPLVCPGSVLANNPGRLTGTTAFAAPTATRTDLGTAEVTVPVTNSSNVTQPVTFLLAVASEGYCLTDIRV